MALVSDRIGGADAGRLAHLWPLLPIIFLPNLALPFTELFRDHPSPWRLSAVLIGVMLFIALYLWTGWKNDISRPIYPAGAQARPTRWRWGPVIGLTGLSIAVILGDGPRWMSLLIFTSAAAGGRFSLGIATRAVGGLMGLAALLGWLTHDNVTDFGPAAFWTGMAGILTIIINHFRRTNKALSSAREEIARLAVETERLRFARDLHDLLGHDLARIALQSEVAEALASTAPDRAIAAMREIGDAARTALQEVRAAVAGYRQPTLAGELRAAGEILAAAGIRLRHVGEPIAVPPAVEAVLAWAVREGVTNVIKHSRAQHCVVTVSKADGNVQVEIGDDGHGSEGDIEHALRVGSDGNGLAGLTERAAALGGWCVAGRVPAGFQLRVVVPECAGGGPRTEESTPERALLGAAAGDRS